MKDSKSMAISSLQSCLHQGLKPQRSCMESRDHNASSSLKGSNSILSKVFPPEDIVEDYSLCDHSHISSLRRICHKIKDITCLNLVIRRYTLCFDMMIDLNSVDYSDEVEVLCPFIFRFLRIKSLRVEFPGFVLDL